ncbi:MAG: hypothetical protein Kow0088_10870 [Anaerolineales bacterium]
MNNLNSLMDSPVFICGHPKSGTTLLLTLLDSHPELVVYPAETVFFRALMPRLSNLNYQEKLSLSKRFLLHYFDSRSTPDVSGSSSNGGEIDYNKYLRMVVEMERILPDGVVRHDGDYLSAAIISFGTVYNQMNPETRYWVEKTPFNEYFSEQIFRWWQNARCIHVIRDPRDNYATYRRKHPNLTLERFSLMWNSSFWAGMMNQKKYGADRYLMIKYEDLVVNPDQTLRIIVEFLDIQDSPTLREPTKIGLRWTGNSMFKDRFEGISTAPIGRWRKELSPREEEIIRGLCRKGMQQCGYLDSAKISLVAWWHLIKFYFLLTRRLPYRIYHAIKKHYEVTAI